MNKSLIYGLPFVLLLAACGSEDNAEHDAEGIGTITVRAYGEAFIEEGIPAADVDDGWAIAFQSFSVSLRDIVAGDFEVDDPKAVDLTKASDGNGQSLGSVSVPAGDHTNSSFTIERVKVVGSAERGGTTKTFDWTFESPTHYWHCRRTTKVKTDGKATFQITVHADHLFYDSLVSAEPQLLFGSIAEADSDDDGEVTQAELAAMDIGSYDPGNDDDIDDLWSFLLAQHRTLGHVDGEGHCEAEPTD
jgi:hypothetical protein